MQIKLDGQWFQAIDAYGTSRTRVFWPTLKPIDKNGNYDGFDSLKKTAYRDSFVKTLHTQKEDI